VTEFLSVDPEDNNFFAAASAGAAGWIVTNNRHPLDLDAYRNIRILGLGTWAELRGL
jgi:predicted nucleic acid-binding protein